MSKGFKNIPPPPGSKAGSPLSRFIPREELGDFASWNPGVVGERRQTPRTAHPASHGADKPAQPPETTEAEWRSRIAAGRQQGYQDGYRDGTAALESFKLNFTSQATAQIGALLDSFDSQFAALDRRLAQNITQVAVQLAQQVLRTELQQNPAVVAQVATEAINGVMLSARHISVHVHPADLPLVAEGAEEALRARGARLLPDAGLERGGVRVESDAGTIDASIATRWAQAAAALGADVPWPRPSDRDEPAETQF
jgi:flagellar assembly protein FliH